MGRTKGPNIKRVKSNIVGPHPGVNCLPKASEVCLDFENSSSVCHP